MPVKLSPATMRAILNAMETGELLREAFELAQKDVFKRMESQILPRFNQSIFGRAFVKHALMSHVRLRIDDGKFQLNMFITKYR